MDPTIPYCGPAPLPATLIGAWNFDPLALAVVLAPLVAAVLMRSVRIGPAVLATAALAVAFVSPLCALTVALFSARSLHHLLLVLIAAPALAAAWPRALPLSRIGGLLGLSLVLWLWHLPAAYALAWHSPLVYWLMQAALLISAWAFWSHVFHTQAVSEGVGAVGKILALAGQMGLLGALLTFAPRSLYPQHIGVAEAFGLDALHDQQLAGLIMWVPGMLPLALLGALLLRRGWRQVALP